MPKSDVATRQHLLDTAQRIMAKKGFSAVGLAEILGEAGVPKGSFYHYFKSKDAFGEALMQSYFDEYLGSIDRLSEMREVDASERIMEYWQRFYNLQSSDQFQGKCLVVKLASEVSDLSEAMRKALVAGTAGIVDRLERMIRDGIEDGSITVDGPPRASAESLYDAWLGASVMAKIQRNEVSLDRVLANTRAHLHL